MSSLEPSNTPKKSIPSESEEEKSELSTPPHEIVYPEGGTRAWLTVLGAYDTPFFVDAAHSSYSPDFSYSSPHLGRPLRMPSSRTDDSISFVNAYGVFNDFYVRIYLSKSSSSQIG